jgi:hypothetical protein
MTSDIRMGSLDIRLGTFERHTWATAEGARREVKIEDCMVISGWIGRDIYNERIGIWAREAKSGEIPLSIDPEKIGALDASHMHMNLGLPLEIFGQLWAAAEAIDGAKRNIHIELKIDRPEETFFAMTKATLIEVLPLRGRGDRLALRGDDREVARAVHHQEGNQAATAIDHRQAHLAAELVRLGNAGGKHLEARLFSEPVGWNDIGHGESRTTCLLHRRLRHAGA